MSKELIQPQTEHCFIFRVRVQLDALPVSAWWWAVLQPEALSTECHQKREVKTQQPQLAIRLIYPAVAVTCGLT